MHHVSTDQNIRPCLRIKIRGSVKDFIENQTQYFTMCHVVLQCTVMIQQVKAKFLKAERRDVESHRTLMLVILLSKPWSPKKPQRVRNFSGIFLRKTQKIRAVLTDQHSSILQNLFL